MALQSPNSNSPGTLPPLPQTFTRFPSASFLGLQKHSSQELQICPDPQFHPSQPYDLRSLLHSLLSRTAPPLVQLHPKHGVDLSLKGPWQG